MAASVHRPSFSSEGTQEMSFCLKVKGEATEASATERAIPASAARRAPQSLAPVRAHQTTVNKGTNGEVT